MLPDEKIETKALVELSGCLAPVDNAPVEVVRRLAWDDDIAVAGPVLAQSARLTTNDLVKITETKSQQHLLAISGRSQLESVVTDALLDRGDQQVVHTIARNEGARFSENGFKVLVEKAETDESLAEKVGLRLDIPLAMLRDLVLRATEAVRSRLLAHATPENKAEVQRVLANVSNEVNSEAAARRDFSQAEQFVQSLQKEGKLSETVLMEFANARRYEEMVAALSALCAATIELISPLMKSSRNDGLLIPCKAAGIKWPTVAAILTNRFAHHEIAGHELAQAKTDYLLLSQASAQRTLRFWQVRVATKAAS